MRNARPWAGFGAEQADERGQLMWASLGIGAVVSVLVLAGWMFVNPPGAHTYRADMTGTGGIQAGADVRIAGVPVGKVASLVLEGDHVVMTFTVDTAARVGDLSSIEVRMLSPVGGYYISLAPSGPRPLGAAHIPADRVRLPFQIPQLLQDMTPVVGEIDAQNLRLTMDKIDRAIADAPGAVHQVLDNTRNLLDVFTQQHGQLTTILDMSNEYLGVVNDNRAVVKTLIDNLMALEPQLLANRDAVRVTVAGIASILTKVLGVIAGPYKDRLEPLVFPLEQAYSDGQELTRRLDDVLNQFRTKVNTLAEYLGPDGQIYIDTGRARIDGPAVCIPIPGQGC
ncbi:MlaD family protein [Nocardia vaccinii]|uniref:MlaD family protein n=1 Tax=Nocardia vaccinii TaxID=1822 RepID=UPI00082FEC92|nr:MlaD family protein [Nocardia vaccinii]